MADQNFAANICLQSAIAQHTTQEADGTEPVPRSTSPALSTASDQPGSDQTPAEGGTSYVIDTSHCVSLSPRDLTSTKNCSATSDSVHDANVHPVLPQAQSRPSSVHPLDHAFFTQQSRIVTLPRFQLPLELVNVICSFLVSEDNCNFVKMAEDIASENPENQNDMCEIIVAAGNRDSVHTVGQNLRIENLNPRILAFLQKYCKSIRGIFVDTAILHDHESLLKLLECVKGSFLKVISFHPFAKVNSGEVHDSLVRLHKQHSDAQVIVIPGIVDRVRGCDFPVGEQSSFFSIMGVEHNSKTYTSVVTRLNGDLATTKRLVTRNKGQIKQMSILCGQYSNNTNWQDQLKKICDEEYMDLEKLYLYDCDPHGLASYIDLAKLKGSALLLATFPNERRQSEEQFYKELVIQKVIADNTDIEELIHVVNGHDLDKPPEIAQATLTDLTENLTRIRKFCWHQGKRYDIPIGQIVSRWKSSLKSFSYRDGGSDLPYGDIKILFEDTDSIESFACDHKIAGLTLQSGKYDAQMKMNIQADGQELSKAISPQGSRKDMKTLVFFVTAISASASGCSENSPEFSRRVDVTKIAVADLVEALAQGGVYVKMLHIVPRGITWACSRMTERHPPNRALSFRVWSRPDEPSEFVTDVMEDFSNQHLIVTRAEHLSSDEENDLFLLDGIGENTPFELEQALIQQHIPRREPAEVYHDRLFGQSQFWKPIRTRIFSNTTEVTSKRAGPILDRNNEKRAKVDEKIGGGDSGGKRGGKGGQSGGKGGKGTI